MTGYRINRDRPSEPFSKRTFTFRRFVATIRDVFAHIGDMKAAVSGGRVSNPFAEKIMLAVTQVNGCRWCNYGHSRAALAAGVSEEELQRLLAQDIGSFPEEEGVALAFAQHYAESCEQPVPAAWQRVVDYYGADTARDIMAYIRMITFGNLFGNTFDALLARLQGRPSPASTLLDEVGVVVLPLGTLIGLTLLALAGLLSLLL